jgi:hypothetical protein
MYRALLLIHVACFAIWMGAVVASLLVVRTLQGRLTRPDGAPADVELLRGYIRREVKLVDVVFIGLLGSGIALAQMYVGWSAWVLAKLGMYFVQFGVTIAFIRLRIRPISYPCTPAMYARWYQLFIVSLGMFAIALLVTYFGR